jgi:hypothetical protein
MGSFWQFVSGFDAPQIVTIVSAVGLAIFCTWAVTVLDRTR